MVGLGGSVAKAGNHARVPFLAPYVHVHMHGSIWVCYITLGGPCKSIGISRSCSWAQLRGGVLGGPVA